LRWTSPERSGQIRAARSPQVPCLPSGQPFDATNRSPQNPLPSGFKIRNLCAQRREGIRTRRKYLAFPGSGQCRCANHMAAATLDIGSQVRQRAALRHVVIRDQIVAPRLHWTVELRMGAQTVFAALAGSLRPVHLNDAVIQRQPEFARQLFQRRFAGSRYARSLPRRVPQPRSACCRPAWHADQRSSRDRPSHRRSGPRPPDRPPWQLHNPGDRRSEPVNRKAAGSPHRGSSEGKAGVRLLRVRLCRRRKIRRGVRRRDG
jgi:hypothetical protein